MRLHTTPLSSSMIMRGRYSRMSYAFLLATIVSANLLVRTKAMCPSCRTQKDLRVILPFSPTRQVQHRSMESAGIRIVKSACLPLRSSKYGPRSGTTQDAEDGVSDETMDAEDPDIDPTNTPEEAMSIAMVSTISFYKTFISPLLPPACRFLPTCSQYGVQAIEKYGPIKGAILTAWRLLRCSPFGGKGYDPPKWPPVPYTYGSY